MGDKRILVVNPNSSERCTAGIRATALRYGGEDLAIEAVTSAHGPAYVETLRDEVVAASALLQLLENRSTTADGGFDALIIACGVDPGLAAARDAFRVPVLGIGESALLLARGTGLPYGIVINTDSDVSYKRAQAQRYGFGANLVSVEAAGFTVEDFDTGREGSREGLLAAGARAVRAGARSLCLTCAAMAGLDSDLAQALNVPVFEGVGSAVQLARTYLELGTHLQNEDTRRA